jgi:hypothetical protein
MLINQNLSVAIDNECIFQTNEEIREAKVAQLSSCTEIQQSADCIMDTDEATNDAANLIYEMRDEKLNPLNLDALIGLAIATAIFRLDYDNQTSITKLEMDDAWDRIEELALDYLKWVGIDIAKIYIDKYEIAQSFKGMDSDELNDLIAELRQH